MEAEMINTPSQLASMFFRFLRQMEQEATTMVGNGYHAGLVNYGAYYGKTHERSCNDRLLELLRNSGFAVRKERPYPNDCDLSCDIVFDALQMGRIWVETKTAWKAWFSSNGKPEDKNPNYWGYLNGNKTHTMVKDLDKLGKIASQDAQYVAEILIGFDSINDPMTGDIEKLIEQEGWLSQGWQVFGQKFGQIETVRHADLTVGSFVRVCVFEVFILFALS